MIRSTEEFRLVVKAARRVGTPLVAVRTADPASAIAQVSASVSGKNGDTPLIVWDFVGGLQGRNDTGKSAVAKVLGENSASLGPGDVLAIAQRITADATLFLLNPQRVWEHPDGYKVSGICETCSRQAAKCWCSSRPPWGSSG